MPDFLRGLHQAASKEDGMTLRPARRRRYALSQYATVRGFSLWQQEWFGFFFPRRVASDASQSADALAVGCIDLLGGSARMDIRMSRAIASFIQILPSIGSVYIQCKEKQGQRTTRPNRPTSRDGLSHPVFARNIQSFSASTIITSFKRR